MTITLLLSLPSKRVPTSTTLLACVKTLILFRDDLFLSNSRIPVFFFCHYRGVGVTTTAQLHSTKPELRFYAGSNPARSVPEIRDGEDLWQWSRLEIRLNAFCRSTIPQKKFFIISSSNITNLFDISFLAKYMPLDSITFHAILCH